MNNQLEITLIDNIKESGVKDTISMVGDFDIFCQLLNINSPMDFLHLFDDLEQVQSKEYKDWILFRYKPNHNFMVYNKKNEEVYINYDEIWSFLRSNFGLNLQEIQGLTKEWLDKVYNLRGVTTVGLVFLSEGIVGISPNYIYELADEGWEEFI